MGAARNQKEQKRGRTYFRTKKGTDLFWEENKSVPNSGTRYHRLRAREGAFMARASIALGLLTLLAAAAASAQPSGENARLRAVAAAPVTDEMLRNPDPGDWLMFSRTYDAQRYSPLSQIDKNNVGSLALAWSKPLAAGPLEIIPLV